MFNKICKEELGWRVLDRHGRLWDPPPQPKEEVPDDSEKSSDDSVQDDHESPEPVQESGQKASESETKPKESELKVQEQKSDLPDEKKLVPKKEPFTWDIYWQDSGMTPDFMASVGPCQRINHFLGMYNICRKTTLGMHLTRFRKEFPEHFHFFPQTWMYPADFSEI